MTQTFNEVVKRKGRIVYIGSTRCLAERMKEHFWHSADEVEFFHAANDEEARIAEKVLIRLFFPVQNSYIPGYGVMYDKRYAPNCTIKRLFSSRSRCSAEGPQETHFAAQVAQTSSKQ